MNTPISEISFFCKRIAKKLKGLGLGTARDLLFYFPFRYEDYSTISKIKNLKQGESATVSVIVESMRNFSSPRKNKKITEVIFSDDTGKIKAIWFNQWFITKNISPGDKLFLIAKLNKDGELISPEYEKASKNPTHTGRIVPIYPLTYGLTQKQVRTTIKHALEHANELEDYLPNDIISENNFIDLKTAIQNIHFPESNELKNKAIYRLSFDELLMINLKNQWMKKDLHKKTAYSIKFNEKKTVDFVKNLPFKLTTAQRKSSWEILKDLEKNTPMSRLLNGDVGSGKTLVAAIGMYNTALSKIQSALLAPTEILSAQHYKNFCDWLLPKKINIALLTRSFAYSNNEKLKKKELIEKIKNGKADIIIGTHALLQESVELPKLGMIVIDEQHRFGVKQRARLSSINKKHFPHLLSMTATPIPRTLSLILYGDLNVSILDEMPSGRKNIKTFSVEPHKRFDAYNFIAKEIEKGRQAFVICPLIDESDKLGVKSVTEEYKKLNEKIFPKFNIGILHGKLKSKEKEETMNKFRDGEIKILVSTSVVEVGVDIPNATVMMIEGAERFGLAQLHQFRGRVGRGEHQSYCLLFPTEDNTHRLSAMEKINDGFKLAEIDLKLRGPGVIYGKEQSGKLNFKIADINNSILIKKANDVAKNIFANDPELKKYPQIKGYLEQELKDIHLE